MGRGRTPFCLGVQGPSILTTSTSGTSLLGALVVREVEFSFHVFREAVPLGVVKPDRKWREPAKHRGADPSRPNSPDLHALEVVGT